MIKENINKLKKEIEEICCDCGRKTSEITLIAVSKNNPISAIKEAQINGLINFGENKAQELRDKAELISESINWHFIGHLQKNKAKYAVKAAEFIHSVDSAKLMEEINKRALNENKIQKILIEVNTSGEENKFGLERFENIEKLVDLGHDFDNIELIGLMTMAPYVADESIVRRCFSDLRELKENLNSKGHKLTELSMGMTNDYKIAIEEGSTMLRIGTAIFGKRDYNKSWKEE